MEAVLAYEYTLNLTHVSFPGPLQLLSRIAHLLHALTRSWEETPEPWLLVNRDCRKASCVLLIRFHLCLDG